MHAHMHHIHIQLHTHVYVYLCGVYVQVLTSVEANNCCGSKRCKNAIEEWCKFLSRLWGRGFVYIFIGIMMVARMEFLDLVVGK